MAIGPLDGSSDPYVVVAIDHCRFWHDVTSTILDAVSTRAELDRDRVLIAFSHTHAAGMVDLAEPTGPVAS